MATITKPMALDESFNTTESTSRNQADVLVGIEQAIVRGFGQVANAVSYDNTDSGLTADNVQDAIDEVDDTVDGLVDDVTEISSDIESTQTVSGNPLTLTDAAPINAESLVVELLPKQDLHGQSAPYVGGAGKNKLPMTVDGIKALNANGTWSGNTYTIGNATFTIETDTGGNVTGIKVNGGNSSNTSFFLISGDLSAYGGMILNGTPNTVEGAYMCAELQSSPWTSYAADYGSGSEISNDIGAGTWIFIRIYAGSSVSNVMFKPMIRLATETDPTFAPYSNICPITGYTECSVDDVGKNLFDTGDSTSDYTAITNDQGSTVYANKVISVSNGVVTLEGASGGSSLGLRDKRFKESGNYVFSALCSSLPRIIIKLRSSDGNRWLTSDDTSISGFTYNLYYGGWFYDVPHLGSRFAHAITIPDGIGWFQIALCITGGESGTNYTYSDIMLEKGSVASSFEPYSSTSATIQFGQTVYGAEVDFEGGTKDTWAKFDTYSGWYKANTDTTVIICEISGKKSGTNQIYCYDYKYVANQGFNLPDGAISDSTNSSYLSYVFINDSRFAGKTIQECEAILESDGMYFVCQLEMPNDISTPRTPLKMLKGTNNLSADGVMQIGYQPDNVIGHTLEVAEDYTDRAVGKNILPMTLAGIKAANPHLTWTDETLFTSGNVTVTFQVAGGDIYGIHIVSTGSNGEFFNLCFDGVDYSRFDGCILSGCDVNDENKIYIAIRKYGGANYFAKNISGDTIINYTAGQKASIFVYLSSGSVDTVLKPMIRKPNMDNTYEPPKPSKEILMDLIAYLFKQI